MQHQCFQLASVLDFQEWKRFLAYFRLNHTRFSPDLEPLMEVIKPQHPRFEMADEAMWRMAFPGREFDNPRMRILRSYIKDLLEEFIIKIDLEADSTRRQLVLAEALLRREGLAPAQRIIATLRSSLPASPMTVQDWRHALDLEELAVDLTAKQGRLIANPPWERLFQKVDGVHVIARLRYLSSMLGTKGFAVTHPELMHKVQDETLRLADPEFLAQAPFAAIYHGLIRLQLGHYEQQDASQLLGLIAKHAWAMDKVERVNIYVLLLNHYFEQQRLRVPGSLEMVFLIFQDLHRQELMFGLGPSTEIMARSAIQVGIRLGELVWVRSFLDECHALLPAGGKERIFRYGSALLDFGEGNFLDAKRHLAHLEITTPAERLYHDNLLMRISYETNDRDGLEVITSVLLRHLYRKEKIAESTKRAAINLAKAVIAIFDLRWSDSPKMDLEKVKAYIDKLQPISHLDWIEAKLEELTAAGK